MPKVADSSDLLSTLTLDIVNATEITWYLKDGGLFNGKIWSRANNTVFSSNGHFTIRIPPSSYVGPVRVRFPDGRTAQVTVPEGSYSFATLSSQGSVKWI